MGRPKKKKADMKEHMVTVRFSEKEYHKIGINLNQIAHHLNNSGIVNDGLISAIKKNISELSKLRREGKSYSMKLPFDI